MPTEEEREKIYTDSELDKLKKMLKEMGATNVNIFPGTNPNATVDEKAKTLRESLERVMAGDCEDVPPLSSFSCPIEYPDCEENCGNYGCGN